MLALEHTKTAPTLRSKPSQLCSCQAQRPAVRATFITECVDEFPVVPFVHETLIQQQYVPDDIGLSRFFLFLNSTKNANSDAPITYTISIGTAINIKLTTYKARTPIWNGLLTISQFECPFRPLRSRCRYQLI